LIFSFVCAAIRVWRTFCGAFVLTITAEGGTVTLMMSPGVTGGAGEAVATTAAGFALSCCNALSFPVVLRIPFGLDGFRFANIMQHTAAPVTTARMAGNTILIFMVELPPPVASGGGWIEWP
jgi:hypothetical protein